MAITNGLKQCHGLVVAHFRAEELLADHLTSASITEVCCPKEEAKLCSNQAYATLGVFVAKVRPPLALRGGEADHVEDEGVHGWKEGEALASLKEQ